MLGRLDDVLGAPVRPKTSPNEGSVVGPFTGETEGKMESVGKAIEAGSVTVGLASRIGI